MKLYKIKSYKNVQSKFESKGNINRANIPIMSTGQSAFYSIVGLISWKSTIYCLQSQELWKCVHISIEDFVIHSVSSIIFIIIVLFII